MVLLQGPQVIRHIWDSFQDLIPIYDPGQRKLHSDRGSEMYVDTRRGLKSGCHQAVFSFYVTRMEPRCSHMPLKRRIEIIGSKVIMREKKSAILELSGLGYNGRDSEQHSEMRCWGDPGQQGQWLGAAQLCTIWVTQRPETDDSKVSIDFCASTSEDSNSRSETVLPPNQENTSTLCPLYSDALLLRAEKGKRCAIWQIEYFTQWVILCMVQHIESDWGYQIEIYPLLPTPGLVIGRWHGVVLGCW